MPTDDELNPDNLLSLCIDPDGQISLKFNGSPVEVAEMLFYCMEQNEIVANTVVSAARTYEEHHG